MVAEAALLFAFSKLSRDSLKKDDILGRALNIIEDEYDNPDFTLEVLAKMLGYNQKYFSRIQKKIGISPKDYKNREFGNKDRFSNDEQRKI